MIIDTIAGYTINKLVNWMRSELDNRFDITKYDLLISQLPKLTHCLIV